MDANGKIITGMSEETKRQEEAMLAKPEFRSKIVQQNEEMVKKMETGYKLGIMKSLHLPVHFKLGAGKKAHSRSDCGTVIRSLSNVDSTANAEVKSLTQEEYDAADKCKQCESHMKNETMESEMMEQIMK